MFLNRNVKVKNNNPYYHLIIGLIFLGMTYWVVSEGLDKPKGIDQFDWIYIAIFGLVGLRFVFKGLSYILRKAYIRVDDEKIAIKPDEESKSEIIYWKDIQEIKQVDNNYEILKKDQSSFTIHFSYFDYKHVDDFKEAIQKTAFEKGVKTTDL